METDIKQFLRGVVLSCYRSYIEIFKDSVLRDSARLVAIYKTLVYYGCPPVRLVNRDERSGVVKFSYSADDKVFISITDFGVITLGAKTCEKYGEAADVDYKELAQEILKSVNNLKG